MKIEKLPSGSYRVRKTYKGTTYTVVFRPQVYTISSTLPQKVKKEPYIPSDDDIKIILAHAKGLMFEVPLLLDCYGLRRSEICALTLADLEDNTIHINKAMVLDKDKNWVIKSTKTTASTRDVIIPPNLADKIREQGFVYQGHPNSITRWLWCLQDDLKMEHFSLHKFRHYFASKMSALNIPEANIIAMGGWETDHVMKMIYRHSLAEDKKKSQQTASDKLSEVIFS